MSKRTGYFGGSPGPPRNERPHIHHHAPYLFGPILPGGGIAYAGPQGTTLASREMSNLDAVYYNHPAGENVMQNNFSDFGAVRMNPYSYGPPIDPFYYGGSPIYYPGAQPMGPQFVNTSSSFGYDRPTSSQDNEYLEWPSNGFSSQQVVPMIGSVVADDSAQNQESRSSSNESAGKSRRFSRQRNIKESSDGIKYQPDPSSKSQQKNLKHEIRFSHQKDQKAIVEKNAEENRDDKTDESVVNPDDSRFSIIRSIGNREIDTGFEQEKKNSSGETKSSADKPKVAKKKVGRIGGSNTSESQISMLLEQLTDGTYECMVCCDRVKQQHAIWNCGKCYHVFHMGCIKKWARSPAAKVEDGGWRCPGCQNVSKKFPSTYNCYCGKVNEPDWNRRETPHSCGEVCSKKRSDNESCTHPCNILCHPGPCPPCPASVIKSCLCGKMTSKVRCSQQKPLMCSDPCGKGKNCGLHKCEVICHGAECNLCDVLVKQTCFCSKSERNVVCGSEEFVYGSSEEVYSCGDKCDKILECGNHTCCSTCHSGKCKPCPLLPSVVTTCPCTQTKISDMTDDEGNKLIRESCTDPVPVCDKICGKPLNCGGDEIHMCKLKCHLGDCPPCQDGESTVHCRCGKSEKEVPCAEMAKEPYICDRRCNKKRKCGRHKCGKTCCIDSEHICIQICGRKLECKLHRCEETCHRGACHTCYNVSFEELNCHCGAEVLYPPIPCGTKPPECSRPCMRPHACHHPVSHNCHNEEKCPPCVVLVKKKCNCGRLLRSNIPCHQENVSCGAPCKKSLPCGHACLKPCHQGLCMEEEDRCNQPCSIMRVECIHPCANPCHHGRPCPPSPCKAMVTLKCSCGNRELQVECSAGGATYQRLSSEAFARQQQLSKGNTVDISSLFQGAGKQKMLPCNEACSALERNRRLAEALNIEDQASIQGDQQRYSTFLQSWVKKDPAFVRGVEQELANIVEMVQWLEQSKRSHTFPSMKREKRQVVHELAEVFNCKSLGVDEEPNRSVFVTAVQGISRIPRILLTDTIKKSPDAVAYSKQLELQNKNSNDDGNKRLLSSMKLVSFKSKSPMSESRARGSDNDQSAKRPASIPRMPSYSSLGKLPSSATSGKSYNSYVGDYSGKQEHRNISGPLTKSASRSYPDRTCETSKAIVVSGGFHNFNNMQAPLLRRPSSSTSANSNKTTQEGPEIDYFDMTG